MTMYKTKERHSKIKSRTIQMNSERILDKYEKYEKMASNFPYPILSEEAVIEYEERKSWKNF